MFSGKKIAGGLAPLWMLCDASPVVEKIAFMRRCRAGGIKALTLHSRAGNLIPFASAEWFEMVALLVEEAARIDMKLWIFDEDPYPSGAAGGLVMAERPDLKARYMEWVEKPVSLKPGELWYIDRRRVIWAGLVPLRAGLPSRDLTASLGPLRADWFSVEWDSRGYYCETPIFPCVRGAAVRLFYAMRVPEIPPGYKLAAVVEGFCGADGPWGSLPDLLQPETFEVFARVGLEPYATAVGDHFGKTVPGIFTDEAKPHGSMPITKDLFPAFREQFRYDLFPKLYQLFGEPLDDDAIRTRLDYRRWIMDRFLGGFVLPFRAWCDNHDLHLVGHFSPEDDPIQEAACLPACMPIMKAMSYPGCDVIVPAVGDESCATLNLGSLRAGSIKSQTGRRYSVSESQALGDWIITSRKTRQIYAWQKMLGIDRFFTHGFFNTTDGVTAREAPPDYGPNSSIFRGTGAVNAWLEQCDAVMDGGTEMADVAVLDNVTAFWAWAPGMDVTVLKQWRHSLWFTILRCLQTHVGIHVLDAADAAEGLVTAEGLTVGARRYRTLLVPAAGLMNGRVFQRLQEASAAGLRVVWFGNGPAKVADDAPSLLQAPSPAGEVRREREPTLAWCRQNLAPQVTIRGPASKDCFVRRFLAEDGSERLFAVNISADPRVFTLEDSGAKTWRADSAFTDGDAVQVGGRQRWTVPALGCGLFTLGTPANSISRVTRTRPAGNHATFERVGLNILRLDRCRVVLKARAPQSRPYPQPFWQCFKNDYRATEVFRTFAGELPVENTVSESDLRYTFTFKSRTAMRSAELVLDPRCARGRFRVFCNGQRITDRLVFPLPNTTPLCLLLPNIRRGSNQVEFRFDIANAMEGLLASVRLQGKFSVWLAKGNPILDVDQPQKVSRKGWLDMGLAHYMGDGVYRWTENLTADDLANGDWAMELDEITDSARLEVNGVEQGTKAWPSWRWALSGLKQGANDFVLTVSSTAGNALSLIYPAQAQGWIGRGRLVRRTS